MVLPFAVGERTLATDLLLLQPDRSWGLCGTIEPLVVQNRGERSQMSNRSGHREPLTEGLRTRLSASQKAVICAAASKAGKSPADFVREAALTKAGEVLSDGQTARAAFEDLIGLVDVPGSVSRGAGSGFTAIVLKKHAPDRRRRLD